MSHVSLGGFSSGRVAKSATKTLAKTIQPRPQIPRKPPILSATSTVTPHHRPEPFSIQLACKRQRKKGVVAVDGRVVGRRGKRTGKVEARRKLR